MPGNIYAYIRLNGRYQSEAIQNETKRPETTRNQPKQPKKIGPATIHFWNLSTISEFLNILSLKSFGNSKGNSYAILSVLDFMYQFTCGESNYIKILKRFINLCPRLKPSFFTFWVHFGHFKPQSINFLILTFLIWKYWFQIWHLFSKILSSNAQIWGFWTKML